MSFVDSEVGVDPLAPLRKHQDGRCAVCQEKRSAQYVDHDHATGLVRGLLCSGCNTREGKDAYAPWFQAYRDNPPAKQIGLRVRYGQHKPQKLRASRAKRADVGDFLAKILPSSLSEVGIAATADEEAHSKYLGQCIALGYAPCPENVDLDRWVKAVTEEANKMTAPPSLLFCAGKAFVAMQGHERKVVA